MDVPGRASRKLKYLMSPRPSQSADRSGTSSSMLGAMVRVYSRTYENDP